MKIIRAEERFERQRKPKKSRLDRELDFVVYVVFPLAGWKLFDIIVWIFEHVRFE